MDAERLDPAPIELPRMKCPACGYESARGREQLEDEWNELVPEGARQRRHVLPSVRFGALWRELGARGSAREAFLVLRAAYSEPHRAYHDACHLGACLRLLDDPEVRDLAMQPNEVEAAIWYHDAVYDTRARDNEEKSALLAEDTLGAAGVAEEIVRRIAAHVRATKEHTTDSVDGRLVIDIDLAILGEGPETFARFEEEIRREYSWVEPQAYAVGRSAVLRKFAERSTIYNTGLFRERYEAKARANIAASLAKLA